MSDMFAEAKEHPAIILGAVGIVVVLALMNRSSGSQAQPTFAGGGAAAGIDPNAAAIEEAAISAGQSNVQSLASLIASENQTGAELTGSLAQTEAGVTIAESTNAAQVAAAQINATAAGNIAALNAQSEAQRIAAEQATQAGNNATAQNIARAHDNTAIVGSLIQNAGPLTRAVGGFVQGVGDFVGSIL